MADNIKEYTKGGKTYYKFKVYTGINPKTGKKSQTTKSGFTTKAAAKSARRKIQAAVADGTYWDDRNDDAPKTVGELFDEFNKLKAHTVRPSTFRNYIHAKKNFKSLLDVKITHLTTDDVLNVIEQKKKTLSIDVLNRYTNVLKAAFSYAFSQGYIKRNVLAQVPRLYSNEIINKKIDVYTPEQLSDFFAKIKEYNYKAYVIARIMAMGGLRIGEVCVLNWDDVDQVNNTINVNKTATIVNGLENVGTTKTKAGTRTVKIDKVTIEALKKWREIENKNNYIFPNRTGNSFYNTGTFRNVLKRFYKHHPELNELTPHGLRHTHASLLFSQNVNPKVIQKRLGHESIEMTLDVYVHLYEDNNSIDEVIEVLNNIEG